MLAQPRGVRCALNLRHVSSHSRPHSSIGSSSTVVRHNHRRRPSRKNLPTGKATTTPTSTTATSTHPLDELTSEEITRAAEAVRNAFADTELRFNSVTLAEPSKKDLTLFAQDGPEKTPKRTAEVVVLVPKTGEAYVCYVDYEANDDVQTNKLPLGTQPPYSPDDCFLAEDIVKADEEVASLLKERYGIEDLALVACDPWSVHLAEGLDYKPLQWRDDGVPARLVQTFLYLRHDADDNHYAHPIDTLPIVDLNARKVVAVEGVDRPAPKLPTASVNYHRNKLASNEYLQTEWRKEVLKPLHIVQPDGPSFEVNGRHVTWDKWTLRVGWNMREGLVLHDVAYDGRSVLRRGSLVEMAVPYGDPNPPFERKCAFDVGDYGLGYCANSLELGCDCLGHIQYFDVTQADAEGAPYTIKKAICMHEEDDGILWKHMEYRNGHAESRRSRKLVLSFIATVVNYEYLFYWTLHQDGSIEFQIKLSGELSTNLLSEGEEAPAYGVMVAPGVNAQVHQHMFCARLDMDVDGSANSVAEVDVETLPVDASNPHGNAFKAKKTVLKTESDAKRTYDANACRTWKIFNPSKINEISGEPVGYKLVPFTSGAAQPTLMTSPSCAVNTRGEFATKNLWVTSHSDDERYPAGEWTPQSTGALGLPEWTSKNRSVENTDVVCWHAFGVMHVPRPEDFPVMPCETTGFMLKPDNFFTGNPSIDLPPVEDKMSKEESSCCSE